jgi:hypothetical protein
LPLLHTLLTEGKEVIRQKFGFQVGKGGNKTEVGEVIVGLRCSLLILTVISIPVPTYLGTKAL